MTRGGCDVSNSTKEKGGSFKYPKGSKMERKGGDPLKLDSRGGIDTKKTEVLLRGKHKKRHKTVYTATIKQNKEKP